MDGPRFDDLLHQLLVGASRRRLLLHLGALPLAGGLAAFLRDDDESEAKKRKRKKKKRKRKKDKNCRGDVCPSGCPFTSVQAAVAAAAPGTTITICPAGYFETIVIDKDLTLVGVGPDYVALHGNGGRTVEISGAPTVEIRNLVIDSGGSSDGGGVIFNDNATTTLVNVSVIGSHAALRGGGIDINVGGHMTLIDCQVEGNNTFGQGGGIHNRGVLMLRGTSVRGNQAREEGTGGGIFNEGTLTLDAASTVTFNLAYGGGGGIVNEGEVTCAARTVSDNIPDQCVDQAGGTGCDTCAAP
jgi:hypothetical protein